VRVAVSPSTISVLSATRLTFQATLAGASVTGAETNGDTGGAARCARVDDVAAAGACCGVLADATPAPAVTPAATTAATTAKPNARLTCERNPDRAKTPESRRMRIDGSETAPDLATIRRCADHENGSTMYRRTTQPRCAEWPLKWRAVAPDGATGKRAATCCAATRRPPLRRATTACVADRWRRLRESRPRRPR